MVALLVIASGGENVCIAQGGNLALKLFDCLFLEHASASTNIFIVLQIGNHFLLLNVNVL